MKRITTHLIPSVAAICALMFIVTPMAMAESEQQNRGLQVPEFVGSIVFSENTDRVDMKNSITVSLSEAASGLDVTEGNLGVVIGENDIKYIVWSLKSINTETSTVKTYLVDAGNSANIHTIENNVDLTQSRDHDKQSRTSYHESNENEEISALKATFFEKLQEMKDARNNGDNERANEIRTELQEIRNQINALR